jgi:hypothetical protein
LKMFKSAFHALRRRLMYVVQTLRVDTSQAQLPTEISQSKSPCKVKAVRSMHENNNLHRRWQSKRAPGVR